jgi:hypothetical protein
MGGRIPSRAQKLRGVCGTVGHISTSRAKPPRVAVFSDETKR